MRDEQLVLILFSLVLLVSLIFHFPLPAALLAGLLLFFGYGLTHGLSWKQLLHMAASGVLQARKVLISLLLIGLLSAVWRASGTIASLVVYAGTLISPAIFLPTAFLLNCLVSFITGTSFGTSATMGIICMAMGNAIGVPAAATGGAILSGAFFGDRCSPVSSSALLVAGVTHTDLHKNIGLMMKSALVPLMFTLLLYLAVGFALPHQGELPNLRGMFDQAFVIHPAALLPAVLILTLSTLHIDVRLALAAGIISGLPFCLLLQHMSPALLLTTLLTGFQSETASVLNGGGLTSMLNVLAIVCISSAYSGIFRETPLLDGIRRGIDKAASRTTPFAAMTLTSIAASAVSCNQTLAIMLTDQLCEHSMPDAQERAIALENSAVLLAPLIPWSIAGSVPLAVVGAPTSGLLTAFYLYLVPLWSLSLSLMHKHRTAERSAS